MAQLILTSYIYNIYRYFIPDVSRNIENMKTMQLQLPCATRISDLITICIYTMAPAPSVDKIVTWVFNCFILSKNPVQFKLLSSLYILCIDHMNYKTKYPKCISWATWYITNSFNKIWLVLIRGQDAHLILISRPFVMDIISIDVVRLMFHYRLCECEQNNIVSLVVGCMLR